MARRHGDLNAYQVFDFRKGLDLKTSPLTLALTRGQNSVRKADNIVYSSSGAASKRFDRATLTTSSVGASVAITGGHQYVQSGGSTFVLFGGNDGKIYKLNTDGTTTTLATGLTTGTKWFFATYNDIEIICNRADAPRKTTDGATIGTLGGSPPATGGPVAVHGNRVFMFDATQKSRLSWCALNNEEDWLTANDAGSLLVSENDGSNCLNLVPSINELVIVKGSRPYRLQGTNPSTFSLTNLVPTTGSVGAVSHHGAVFARNEVWYASLAGIIGLATVQQFGDIRSSFASDRISPYFEAGTGYTLSLQNLDDAVAAYDAQNNRLYVAVDSDADDQNDLVLVYDLQLNAWSVWPNVKIASMWPVKNAATGLVEIYAGGYDGHVRVLNRDVSTNAIDGHVRHLSCLNAPGVEKSPRHVFLYLKEQGNYCVVPGTRVLTQDLRWVPVESLRVGDALLGFDEHATRSRRQIVPSYVVSTGVVQRPVWAFTLSDGTVLRSSSEHPWLVARKGNPRARWETTEDIARAVHDKRWRGRRARVFPRFLPVWETATTNAAGYLAAAFDGEGCVGSRGRDKAGMSVSMAQRKNEMLARVEELLTAEGVNHASRPRPNGVCEVDLLGRFADRLGFLGTYRPVRLLARLAEQLYSRRIAPRLEAIEWLEVVAAEYLGECDVIAMGTSSRTYFAEGFGAHNTVSVDTKFDFGATGGQTYTASLLGGSKTLGVTWTLGTDPLGAKEQIIKRIDLRGVGEFLEIGVRNQNAGQKFTLYGYECLWRHRRVVRRGTAA